MTTLSMPNEGLLLQGITAPLRLSDFKLIAFDMDSALINIECIDEIADAAGRKAEAAAITEAAMRGEIADYKASLRQRGPAARRQRGANDLPMMSVAGLSVAYHAKPAVREKAKVAINSGGLDRLLDVMDVGGGYSGECLLR